MAGTSTPWSLLPAKGVGCGSATTCGAASTSAAVGRGLRGDLDALGAGEHPPRGMPLGCTGEVVMNGP
jgi:hypothetical protein